MELKLIIIEEAADFSGAEADERIEEAADFSGAEADERIEEAADFSGAKAEEPLDIKTAYPNLELCM